MLEKIRAKKKRGFFRLIFLKIQLKQDARAACWGIYGQIPVFHILPVTARIVLRANPCFPHFARNPHARQAKHQIDQNPAAINMQKTGLLKSRIRSPVCCILILLHILPVCPSAYRRRQNHSNRPHDFYNHKDH